MRLCEGNSKSAGCGDGSRPQICWVAVVSVALPLAALAVRAVLPLLPTPRGESAPAGTLVDPAAATSSTLQATKVLRFGVVPQQAPSQVFVNWVPLASRLSELTGITWLVETAPSIPEFEQRLAAGAYDTAYMNPYHYVVFSDLVGYRAFAREKDERLQGILVVERDSAYHEIADLEGASAAFPAPAAFAASVLTRNFLRISGVHVDVNYVNSHDSVYRNVASGVHDVGGGVVRTFDAMPTEVTSRLRILWKTPQYTPHAFAYHPRLPAETIERIVAAVAELHEGPADADVFASIGFSGLAPGVDADWDDIRALGISELHETGLDPPQARSP